MNTPMPDLATAPMRDLATAPMRGLATALMRASFQGLLRREASGTAMPLGRSDFPRTHRTCHKGCAQKSCTLG